MKGRSLKAYLFAGLAVWLPILVTFLVLRFIIHLLDQSTAWLPAAYQPEQWIGYAIPGTGVVLSFLILLLTGLFVTNFFGQKFVRWSESLLARIPVVRTIYNGTKQVIQGIFSSNSQAFRTVVLVEYPRKGLWTLAFQTGEVPEALTMLMGDEVMISIYIPTTPNPTSGFWMMVSKKEVIELSISVDDAFKRIISLGVASS